jgi:hypothetical protein
MERLEANPAESCFHDTSGRPRHCQPFCTILRQTATVSFISSRVLEVKVNTIIHEKLNFGCFETYNLGC